MSRWILFVAAAFAFLPSARAAEPPKDLAELFPAGTLAYAEIGQPAGTSDALVEFLKGTLLADGLGHSHDRRDKTQPGMPLVGLKRAGEWSLLASPETLADFRKLRGVAAGVTGFDAKTGRPSMALAVVLGDSVATGLLVRQYLLTADNIRRVGKIDGIPVYQNRGLTGAVPDEEGKPKPVEDPAPPQGPAEPTYFLAPGLFVVGSSVEAAKDVYRRHTGAEKSAGFGASSHLKPHAEARRKPGVFFCADAAAFDAQLLAAKKASSAEWLKCEALAFARFPPNPRDVKTVAGSLQLQPDGWTLAVAAEVKPGGACPLLALLSGGMANPADRFGAPAEAPGVLTVAFPEKEKRAKAVLDAADAVALALGLMGALPSERAAEGEKAGVALSSRWLPQVKSLTVIQPKPSADPKAPPSHPLAVLTLDDEDAAKGWLALLPTFRNWLPVRTSRPNRRARRSGR